MADISVSLRMPMIIETVPLWVYAKSQESALEWALRQPTSPLDLIASGISMFEVCILSSRLNKQRPDDHGSMLFSLRNGQ